MRFLADGPWLPDELLVACDQGRVLFFCGAGVSRAKAGLPDFLGLAKSVLRELRTLPESPAQKLVDMAERLDSIPGVGGIVAADRIFGLLEREFSIADIERAVGVSLKPQDKVDLSAHRTLLALSRDASGKIRLVTTNFDLLFEKATRKVQVWTPSQLPDLKGARGFEGIVHLHGMFDSDYGKPIGGNLVLSSAEFGRAYLAEGWATDFFRALIRNYLIVFVGYAADDPPVQYLLEALNRVADIPPHGLYAFQVGREQDARALWTQKGVRAIPYAPDDGHAALWATLKAWADQARDPERWRERLIHRARRGPQALQPHERGQVVHLASTEDGARSILQAKQVPPSSWLCVFDRSIRYGRPGKVKPLVTGSPHVDPFTDYGLDSDPPPPPTEQNQLFQPREIPAGAIDVLAPIELDQPTIGGNLRGREALSTSELSPRLLSLGVWLRRVCGEPAAIWWASGQDGLHPAVIRQIEFALNQKEPALSALARSTWRYLLEAWRAEPAAGSINAFALMEAIGRDGWTQPHIRRFAEISRCWLTVSRPWWAGPLSPGAAKQPRVRDLIYLEVRYPERHVRFEIPDEQLLSAIPLLRQNLEYAIDLQNEINPRGLPNIVPIEPDPNLAGTSTDRDFGINAQMLDFVDLFRRLVHHDKGAALRELAAWRQHHDPVFERLRIWAASLDNLLDDAAASRILADTDDAVFWSSRAQRNLLLGLRRRWPAMPVETRAAIEQRLLTGPPRLKGTSAADNRQWRALKILERVIWLRDQGCVFAANVQPTLRRHSKVVPQWSPAEAARAVESLEARGGAVMTDTSFRDVASAPLSELIARALQGQKQVWGESRRLDPFAGLCERRPVRVLAGLRYYELQKGADVARPWTQFLHSAASRSDKQKVAGLIARRLARLPRPELEAIIMPATYWLASAHKQLYERDRDAFRTLFDKLLDTLAGRPAQAEPPEATSGEVRDWANLSFNSAAGRLADALLGDPILAQLAPRAALPDAWLISAHCLLALPGDHARLSLVRFAQSLGFLHIHAAAWSERCIAAAMLEDGAHQDAALAGFLTNPWVGDRELYSMLKPLLIGLGTTNQLPQRRYPQALARLFVGGWLTRDDGGTRWLADDEFRRVLVHGDEDLRGHVLWQVARFDEIAEKITFLRKVWPLQLAVRTTKMVGRLCTLAFGDEVYFAELVSAILPLVSADRGHLNLPVRAREATIIEKYPDQLLELLATVLPDDVTCWDYGVNQTLERLTKTNPSLVKDPRMIRLKGMWDRR